MREEGCQKIDIFVLYNIWTVPSGLRSQPWAAPGSVIIIPVVWVQLAHPQAY